MSEGLNRREFVKASAAASLAVAMAPNIVKGVDDRKVRLGFIGVGGRGTGHLGLLLRRKDIEVPAVCDIKKDAVDRASELVIKSGRPKPTGYTSGEEDFRNLVIRDDLDGVVISTPWEWHVPMAVAAMKAGKYAGVEVPAATTIDGCWDLVNTSEQTGVPCMILENVCYRRDVMAALNILRQGLFGEIVHCECGYRHDLRQVKFSPGVQFGQGASGEAVWRTAHSIKRNGELYPTHGIGPIAEYIDINRGNRFVSLTSTASKARGLRDYIIRKAGENHPNAKIEFALGDVVTTVIKCANGEIVTINHDTNTPHPYSLGFRIQGTRGIWNDVNGSIYIEGRSPKEHTWEPFDSYLKEFDHPLWKKYAEEATGAGHGGMDFFVMHAFVESIKRKVPPPIDVYDAAAWSVITPLSEQSIAQGSAPMPFPDFTDGRWMYNKPSFGFGDEY